MLTYVDANAILIFTFSRIPLLWRGANCGSDFQSIFLTKLLTKLNMKEVLLFFIMLRIKAKFGVQFSNPFEHSSPHIGKSIIG